MPEFFIDFLQEGAQILCLWGCTKPSDITAPISDILWPFGFSGNFSKSSSVQLCLHWTTLINSSTVYTHLLLIILIAQKDELFRCLFNFTANREPKHTWSRIQAENAAWPFCTGGVLSHQWNDNASEIIKVYKHLWILCLVGSNCRKGFKKANILLAKK